MYLINNCRNLSNTKLFGTAYTPKAGRKVLTSLYPEQEEQYGGQAPEIGDRCWYAVRCQADGTPYPHLAGDTHSHVNISLWEIVDLPRVVPDRDVVERYQLATGFRPERRRQAISIAEFCGEEPAFDARQLLVVGKLVIPSQTKIVAFTERLDSQKSIPEFFTANGHWQQFSIRLM